MSRSRGEFNLAPARRDVGRDAYRDAAHTRDVTYPRNQGVVISNPAASTAGINATGRAEVLRLRR